MYHIEDSSLDLGKQRSRLAIPGAFDDRGAAMASEFHKLSRSELPCEINMKLGRRSPRMPATLSLSSNCHSLR